MQPSWNDPGHFDSGPLTDADLSDSLDLANEVRARVKGELQPGERLLWAGQPFPPPAPVGVGYLVVVAIALVLIAFGVGAMGHALGDVRARANNESTMPLGIGLSLIGCIMIICTVGSRFSERIQRSRMASVCYAVTDHRAITWIPEPKTDAVRVHSVFRGQIEGVVRLERPDGSGSLEFAYSKNVVPYHWQYAGFQHIPEVRRVEQIIRNNLMTNEVSS
jgi:hypothetical protein